MNVTDRQTDDLAMPRNAQCMHRAVKRTCKKQSVMSEVNWKQSVIFTRKVENTTFTYSHFFKNTVNVIYNILWLRIYDRDKSLHLVLRTSEVSQLQTYSYSVDGLLMWTTVICNVRFSSVIIHLYILYLNTGRIIFTKFAAVRPYNGITLAKKYLRQFNLTYD